MDNKILAIGLIKTDMVIATLKDSGKDPETDFSSKDSMAILSRSDTKLIGCIGDGIFEMSIITNYTENQANSENIINVPGVCTGTTISITKNANTYTAKDNRVSLLHTANIIDSLEEVIKDIDLVVTNLEIPIKSVEEVMNICKRYNVRFLLYPAPALKIPDDLLSRIDIIAADACDVETITGITILQIEHAAKAVKYLLSKGVKQVVLTLGNQGIIYSDRTDIFHKTFLNYQNANVTNDLFIGVLAVCIAMGKNINEAVEFAGIVSSTVGLK